nr:acyltransferase family protein [Nocardioides perillae]
MREDVQGLRAVAVLTVIAAHADFAPVEGGFVGVDVFFVISGFLISQLLFREVARTGRVSLGGFYARRARRILPAATVVTVATVVASLLWTSLVEARDVLTDAVWASLFAANVRFASSGVDYFAQDQGPSPLQHYWSLAVEEQFYLVWPLVLLGCLAWAARRSGRARPARSGRRRAERDALPRTTVVLALGLLTATSLAWSVWTTAASPETAYFSTLARAWELGVGALAALVGPALVRSLAPRGRAVLATGGLVAIVAACLLYTEATPFPGYAALLPVLGSAAVLLAGLELRPEQPVPAATRWLGAAPMRLVGDWSYSLYLWHWPVLVVLEARLGREPGLVATALALVATFALAGLTYRFVETPFRSTRTFTVPRGLVLYPASLVLVLVTAAGGTWWTRWAGGELGDDPAITLSDFGVDDPAAVDLAADPAVALVQASVLAARSGMAVPSDLSPDLLELRDDVAPVTCDYADDSLRELCPGGDTDAERSIVLLGDSHARAWVPAFERIAEEAGYRTYHLVKVQCTAADVTVAALGTRDPWPECSDFRDWATDQVAEVEPDLVVVSTSPPVNGVYDDAGRHLTGRDEVGAEMRAGYERLFAALAPHADRLVLLEDVPRAPEDPATCMTEGDPSLAECMFEPAERASWFADLSVEVAREADVEVVETDRWFCWDGSCPVVVGSTLTYRDPGHITSTYAAELAGPLGDALGLTGPGTGPLDAAAGAGGSGQRP